MDSNPEVDPDQQPDACSSTLTGLLNSSAHMVSETVAEGLQHTHTFAYVSAKFDVGQLSFISFSIQLALLG